MTRADNLLFVLYAWRVAILTRDQLLAICASLRHGKDIDIGMSLAKRGIIDEQQMDAIWNLVGVQTAIHGTAKKVIQTVETGEQVRLAVQLALRPQRIEGKSQGERDAPTIRFD
jgi:hypothetical protein